MPKRALYEKRPYLLASIAAAVAYYLLRDGPTPGLYLSFVKGTAVAMLAIYAMLRHRSRDAQWLAGVMAIAALADVIFEFDEFSGGLLYFVSLLMALALFLRNLREQPSSSQKAAATALLLTTPLISWLLSQELSVALYGLALGGMAGSAWVSRFSRYHVGLGAVLFVASDFLVVAQMHVLPPASPAEWFSWPLYYCGQFLICTGVIQTLRRDHQA
ncbi:hypothetical protein MB02_03180 [Croceicoccus estronivorus]|uniref:lysoplasmalogenase family protein n=1 Tax=Croceicoccus estronivorus TaxID=1172626 RepID=UPI00082C7768|nr:lysoplasmalogenase family protein [Croceicoccus estronivorus]OCC24507.1 hypothetical protein MB02_03180 [Croceicoccus estronivorus]